MRDNKGMIISSPYLIMLSAEERAELTVRANRARAAHRDVVRARIILAAADGRSNAAIAAHLRLHVDTVRKWRRRFHHQRLAGLTDRPRTGRPRRFSAVQVAEVKALACELPADADIPLAKWSCPELAAEASRRGVVASISASTVRRWLAADAIRPWQHRSWIFPRDPDFAFKAGRVLDLYARIYDGIELGEDEYVLSADEKPGVQARERIHPAARHGQAAAAPRRRISRRAHPPLLALRHPHVPLIEQPPAHEREGSAPSDRDVGAGPGPRPGCRGCPERPFSHQTAHDSDLPDPLPPAVSW